MIPSPNGHPGDYRSGRAPGANRPPDEHRAALALPYIGEPDSPAVACRRRSPTSLRSSSGSAQNPADVDSLVSLGNIYYDAGRYTEAIPWYEKAVEKIPTNTDVRTDLGTAYFYSGNNDKAKEHWGKVFEQDPNKIQAHFNLGVLYSGLTPPDNEAAAREWETVIRIAPDSPDGKQAVERLKKIGKR